MRDLTTEEEEVTQSLTVSQMVKRLSPPGRDMDVMLRGARPRALFAWWHCALALELSSERQPWEKKLAAAVAGKIAAEAVRRCGPDEQGKRA